jgi:hypothetical protein
MVACGEYPQGVALPRGREGIHEGCAFVLIIKTCLFDKSHALGYPILDRGCPSTITDLYIR